VFRNYGNFDLSIHDIRSGIAFFDQLPRSLQKGYLRNGNISRLSAHMVPDGFGRVSQVVKEELRRIAKTLVVTPGEQC
jgi:hypothetical protein